MSQFAAVCGGQGIQDFGGRLSQDATQVVSGGWLHVDYNSVPVETIWHVSCGLFN
jgi:hypothetical protein